MLAYAHAGVPTVDYGNNIRQMAHGRGRQGRVRLPGLRARLYPAAVLPRRRAVPLGRPLGRSGGHLQDRRQGQGADAGQTRTCTIGSTWRAARIKFQGLPARICWVGLGDRHRLGLAFNEMVASGELKAPIVIGRDHLDSGSVASPNRETEAMQDGSDAVSDWPLLNALLNCASRRDLGVDPSRRRRRHGLFAARRHGRRLRRHRRKRRGASSGCCGTTRRAASCATPTRAMRSPSMRARERPRPAEPGAVTRPRAPRLPLIPRPRQWRDTSC